MEEIVEEKPLTKREIRRQKRLARREKRNAKLRYRLIERPDIKFRGPFSYRYLRAIGWLGMALAQLVVLNAFSSNILENPIVGSGWATFFDIFSNITTPLFIVASFSLLFNQRKAYKSVILSYSLAFLAIGGGLIFIYYHYIVALLKTAGVDASGLSDQLGIVLGSKVQVNIFADLLMVTLVNFFINYTPRKFFKGKKVFFFRLFVILPTAYLLAGYILKTCANLDVITLPLEVYPFLPTKNILVHIIFIIIAIWMKNRERLFLRIGATREDYKEFLKTNKNSLAFAIELSVLFVIFTIIDLAFYAGTYVLFASAGLSYEEAFVAPSLFGMGQCLSLIIAAPFIMFFSYTRTHKEKIFDVLIPVIGIVLCVLVYLEGGYNILITILSQSA